MRRRALLLLAGMLLACGPNPHVTRHLPLTEYPSDVEDPSKTLIVFIAGITDSPSDIERHGVLQTLRAAGAHAPMALVYRAMPAYFARSTTQHLRREVVAPARLGGRERFVWVGFSGGAAAAIAHARQSPEDVDALVLYAPYLGPSKIVQEIIDAGGLDAWTPFGPVEEVEREWLWLKGYLRGEPRPPLILLFGSEDLERPAAQVLADAGLTEHVIIRPGRHGWDAWKPLWEAVLDEDPLEVFECKPGASSLASRGPSGDASKGPRGVAMGGPETESSLGMR